MNYRVTGSSKGGRKVEFTCPRCTFELESPLEEAGNSYACPTCGQSVVVPGIEDLKRARADDVRKAEAEAREDARRNAEEKERQERRACDARERVAAEVAAARAKEERRAQRAASAGRGVSGGVFSASLLAGAIVLLAVVYGVMVAPLRRELADTQTRLDQLTAGVESLRQTVNHNADTANRTTSALARELAETAPLARNADRHAHSHPRF